MKLCSAPDCNDKFVAKGYCDRHYRHFKKHGKPIKTIRDSLEIDRFYSKIKIDDTSECHEWTDALCPWGYGMFRPKGQKQVKAHRYSYALKHGAIPDGMYICHHCDNPKCVNVQHLFLGTALENNKDKIDKNRHNSPKGVNHFRVKVSEQCVIEVKKLLKEIKSPTKVAKQLNVPVHFVENIKYKRTWNHVQD